MASPDIFPIDKEPAQILQPAYPGKQTNWQATVALVDRERATMVSEV